MFVVFLLISGIFELLDEASLVPVVGSKDDFFCSRVNTKLACGSVVLAPPKGPAQSKEFAVRHFAADVIYTAEGFNEKNVDIISNDLRAFLMESCDSFISQELCAGLKDPENTPTATHCTQCGERRLSLTRSKPVSNEDKRHGCVPFFIRRSNESTSQRPTSAKSPEQCHHCGAFEVESPHHRVVFDESGESSDGEGGGTAKLYGTTQERQNEEGRGRAAVEMENRSSLGTRVRNNSRRMRGKTNRRQLEHKAKSLASLFSVQVSLNDVWSIPTIIDWKWGDYLSLLFYGSDLYQRISIDKEIQVL